jgi:hypothetical protein
VVTEGSDGASGGGAWTSAAVGISAGRAEASSSLAVASDGGATGFAVLTSRGGGSFGLAGATGSAAFLPPRFPRPLPVSTKALPLGSAMSRFRATRSTNCRATTSSMVLDALFTSMPWSRFNSALTSWLVVPSNSATL